MRAQPATPPDMIMNLAPGSRRVLSGLVVAWAMAMAGARAAGPLPYHYEADVPIPMRDGVSLAANIFRPGGEGVWPTILYRTPYGKQDANWSGATNFAAKGYVVVVQDCRGRGKSAGVWEPFLHEAADGFDTQEWIGRQPWSNRRIGTSGGSYVGWTQWASAPKGSRYLKAMVPMVPFGNTYDDVAYQGGALMLGLLMGWGEAVGGVFLESNKQHQAYQHLPLATFGDQFTPQIEYLNEWVRHSSPDSYWKARGIDRRYRDVTVPTLNVGGWYDIFSKTTLELTAGVRAQSRSRKARRQQFVIMGPWGHGVAVRKTGSLDFGPAAELKVYSRQWDWYEYWLKGRDTGVQNWPPYYLFVMGENQWRGENEWPLQRTKFTRYFLHSGGGANTRNGDGRLVLGAASESLPDHFNYDGNDPVPTVGGNNIVGAAAGPIDQSEVELRRDVLVYSTAVLDTDVEVTGPIRLVLWAASSAPDTDFTGKLVDVHPDGKAYNLCEGIVRARHRAGARQSELLQPGRPERFDIDLWVTSNLFKRGHQVRLEVSSSNFPRFDRNPNSGLPFGTDEKLLPGRQTILHDRQHPSHLLLPVIPR